jgi:O-antigen/teichoic acid export membrane protein
MKRFIDKSLVTLRSVSQKGFFHLLSANVLIQAVAFGSQLLVAAILAPDDIGRIKIIQTYLSIFSIVAGMGFNASTLKLCSENRTEQEQASLFRSGLYFTLITTILTYLLMLILNGLHLFSSDQLINNLIPLGLLPIITNSLFMMFVAYFQATKRIKLMSGLVGWNKLIAIVALLVFAYQWGIKGYYWAYNLSFIIMLLVCLKYSSDVFRNKFSFKFNFSDFKVHWKYAKLTTLCNVFSEIAAYADILIIGVFVKDMQQIGYYSFALTLTVMVRLLPGTVQQVSIPYFSSQSNDSIDFMARFKYFNAILSTIIGVTLIALLITVPIAIQFIFGEKFMPAIPFFVPLVIGWSIRQLLQLQVSVIFGLGKVEYNLYTSIISLIFNVLIVSICLHYFSLIGAAYASIPSGIVVVLCSFYYLRRLNREISN